MNSKSLDSYKDLTDKLSLRQAQVLKELQFLKTGTNRMIAKSLGWDINRVTGRVSELRKKGLIVYSADYYDTETDRTVNLWKLR
tara:strand:- start:47526 stop:47777 length:252 start_codon:yes stop_codon:yes gene_type:complete